jgi:hypothetical protein
MHFSETFFKKNKTREKQLKEHFNFIEMEPNCKDEFIKIPLDLPWDELEKDVELAFEKFGWYGMIHRQNDNWDRSKIYGGLGLTYNPDYKFDIPKHAQGFGQPRATKNSDNIDEWLTALDKKSYKNYENKEIEQLNTYDDCLGLRERTDVTYFRSFKYLFDLLPFNPIQGRIAQIRAADYGDHPNKDFIWHRDEKPDTVARVLIPLVYSDDYFIEFKDSGTKFYFEPGYGYHWNVHDKIHRWSFNYHENIINRTCIVLGFSPWLKYENNKWFTNEYFNNMHVTDMIKSGLVF